MGLHNMNKTLLLATAVTAAVFGAHGAAAAVTGNPQTYTTNVTLSGAAVGTGVGTGIAEFDDTSGTGGIAAFKTVSDTVTTVTTPGLGTATVSSVSVYDGTIVGTTFTSTGKVATTLKACTPAPLDPLAALICAGAGTIDETVITTGATPFALNICTGGTWNTISGTDPADANLNIDHTSINSSGTALCVPPAAPTDLISAPGDSKATISFTPGDNYGATITNYEYSLDGGLYTALDPIQDNSPITIEGLTDDTLYSITIRAISSAGKGTPSIAVEVTPGQPAPPATPPGPPTDLSATPGDGGATISFTPGAINGAVITNYEYSLDGGLYTPRSPASAVSPITITGLTNGTPYSITLRAINSAGSSVVASAAVVVIPLAPPIPPEPAAAIPTMSAYGLGLTVLGVFVVAVRRLRTLAKPK